VPKMVELTPAETVIDRFGGVRETARQLTDHGFPTSPSAVSKWKKDDGLVPSAKHKPLLQVAAAEGHELTSYDLIHGSQKEDINE